MAMVWFLQWSNQIKWIKTLKIKHTRKIQKWQWKLIYNNKNRISLSSDVIRVTQLDVLWFLYEVLQKWLEPLTIDFKSWPSLRSTNSTALLGKTVLTMNGRIQRDQSFPWKSWRLESYNRTLSLGSSFFLRIYSSCQNFNFDLYVWAQS